MRYGGGLFTRPVHTMLHPYIAMSSCNLMNNSMLDSATALQPHVSRLCSMATRDPAQKATADLDRLTSAFTQSEERLEAARVPLHEAIIRHLEARSAPPGKIADHTPYDRNHVGRIAKAAGVPPLRGPNAGPAPVYDDKTEAKALAELDRLTATYEQAAKDVEKTRKPLQAAIVKYYADRTLTPGVIAQHSPYDRNHVGRVVKAAGAPSIRG